MIEFPVDDGQYNVGYLCTTRHCEHGRGERTAMRWIDPRGQRSDYTFADLDRASNRFANALETLGFASGDVLFTFLPKMPEQFVCFLGALKAEVICGTLFSNFGEEALLDRLGDSGAKGIVTKKSFLKKIPRSATGSLSSASSSWWRRPARAMLQASWAAGAARRGLGPLRWSRRPRPGHPFGPALHLRFHRQAEGRAAPPRGHRRHRRRPHGQVLGLRPDDIFWCTADQGWVTGTSYGIIGPWSLGVTQVHYGGGYDAGDLVRAPGGGGA